VSIFLFCWDLSYHTTHTTRAERRAEKQCQRILGVSCSHLRGWQRCDCCAEGRPLLDAWRERNNGSAPRLSIDTAIERGEEGGRYRSRSRSIYIYTHTHIYLHLPLPPSLSLSIYIYMDPRHGSASTLQSKWGRGVGDIDLNICIPISISIYISLFLSLSLSLYIYGSTPRIRVDTA